MNVYVDAIQDTRHVPIIECGIHTVWGVGATVPSFIVSFAVALIVASMTRQREGSTVTS